MISRANSHPSQIANSNFKIEINKFEISKNPKSKFKNEKRKIWIIAMSILNLIFIKSIFDARSNMKKSQSKKWIDQIWGNMPLSAP
jgi:hypothetical protein